MSPGYKTTEFYLTLLAQLLAAFLAAGLLPDAHIAVKVAAFAAAALAQLGYSVSRGWAKGAAAAPPPTGTEKPQ